MKLAIPKLSLWPSTYPEVVVCCCCLGFFCFVFLLEGMDHISEDKQSFTGVAKASLFLRPEHILSEARHKAQGHDD